MEKEAQSVRVKKLELKASLKEYKDGFQELIEGYNIIGLDQESGFRGGLRTHVHKAELMLEEVSKHLLEVVSKKESMIKSVFISLSLLIEALVLATLILAAKSILTPISALIESINNVTQSCDFTQRYSIKCNGEVAQISTALGEFYHTLHDSINETNRVMNAVATGDFTQRAEASVKGDLETLRVAANKSSESVMCNMHALEKNNECS